MTVHGASVSRNRDVLYNAAMPNDHFSRPKRRTEDVRTHYNLNTGGYTVDRWGKVARGKCRGQSVRPGAPRWLCDDDQTQELLLQRAYSGYDRTGHRKYLESFRVCGFVDTYFYRTPDGSLGKATDRSRIPDGAVIEEKKPMPVKAGTRNVHAHVYGIPSDAAIDVNDGTWRRARYSADPPCFVDMETGQCLPNDGSIDVFLASAPNTQARQTYCTKRKPPASLPTMFWRLSR